MDSPPVLNVAAARISQRAPKSCQRCSVKKMKCTKTIPCTPCIDNGLGDQCQREQVITTKHIRQAHRRHHREFTVRVTEHAQSRKRPRDDKEDTYERVPAQRISQAEYQESVRQPRRPDVTGNTWGKVDGNRPRPMNLPLQNDPTSHGVEHIPADMPTTLPNSDFSASPAGVESSTPAERPLQAAPDPSLYNEQADIENAATSLELLAWGRQRDIGVSPNSVVLLPAEALNSELLLPQQARLVLCFHRDWINWTHNTIHWPTFNQECQNYWREGIVVEKAWLSVYYAALCAALIVMSPDQRRELGISRDVSKHLYHRSIDSLKEADYAANHTRRCVQAICLITPCAHVFGGSNLVAVLLSSAIRIAQTLNMHRIGADSPRPLSDEAKLDREIQKSLWAYLCTQDWFYIPFTNAHAISPAHCTTPLPINCDGISGFSENANRFQPLSMDCPTQVTYMLNMFQAADVCRSYFDKTAALTSVVNGDETLRTLYEHVLTADAQLKTISKTCSSYLRHSPVESYDKNPLLSIQRTAFIISVKNKILMMHRRFFLRSLADRWYTYSRLACMDAAKTILELYQTPLCHELARNLWQVVAHVIGACVTSLLAMILSDEDYHDRNTMRQLICACVNSLSASQNANDMLHRGLKLINIMLEHEMEIHKGHRARALDIRHIASELHSGDSSASSVSDGNFFDMPGSFDLEMLLQPFEEPYGSYMC